MQGGSFIQGAAGGLIGKYVGYQAYENNTGEWHVLQNTMIVAGSAYLSAKVTGGRPEAATTAAVMVYLFNEEAAAAQKEMSRADFENEYGDILEAGGIDIDANVKEASTMDHFEWKDAVKAKGKWDYKKSKVLIAAGISPARLDEFGNVHFGIVAAAHGFNLATSLFGAGSYQVFFQRGGSVWGWGNAPLLASNDQARFYTRMGWNWGDNPGDSLNIMKGWDYYDKNY